jgi:O-antigen/teichoic acid export membrane protein
MAGGNVAAALLRVVGGILQARFVEPVVLGQFNALALALGYAPFLQLGILNGLNRELPYYIGRGERQRVGELAAAAQAWALLLGATGGSALLLLAGWFLLQGNWELAAGWATQAALLFALFYSQIYLQMTYRTSHDFARLAMVQVVDAALALGLVALVALWSFYGICLRTLIAGLAAMAMLHYWRPVRVGPRWNFVHLKHLLWIGAPIFAVGQLFSWWSVLDQTLVLSWLGKEGMGLYALVVVAGGTMQLIPLAASQVLYPRMAEQYGRTHRLGDLLRMVIKPTLVTTAGMAVLAALGWWVVEPAIQWVLPKYVEAVPAVRWSLVVAAVQSLSLPNNIYNVVRRQDLYAVAMVIGMGAYLAALWWLIREEVPLAAFPQAMLVGRAAFVIATSMLLITLVYKSRANNRR